MATSNNGDYDDAYFERGSCRIILKQGDLFDEVDVDAIVIPTPANGQSTSHDYPLFRTLSSSNDQVLNNRIKECISRIRQGEKPQCIADSKPLKILTSTPYYGNEKRAYQMLKSTYIACLKLAIEENCQSIAFPTIGCGPNAFPTIDAAENLYQTLASFDQPRNKPITEIRIIIYTGELCSKFQNIFINLACEKNAKIKFNNILSRKSDPTGMPLKKDDKPVSQRGSVEKENPKDYPDDFEADTPDKHDGKKKQVSSLNPETPEFKPRGNNQSREPRSYILSNKKSELHIIQGDILKIKVDAIVNAANESMVGGSGVDGAIHEAAGNELRRACKAYKQIHEGVRLPTGHSRILLSYEMSKTTNYIINTAGPRFDDYPRKESREYLTSCYKTSLALANLYDLETIAFTAISCGIFGYPLDEGAEVALTAVDKHVGSMRKITFVLLEDDLYDAWIDKAEQLKSIWQDDHGSKGTSTSKSLATDARIGTEHGNTNDEDGTGRSTSDSIRKPAGSTREEPSTNPDDASAVPRAAANPKSTTKKDDNHANQKPSNDSSKSKQSSIKETKVESKSSQKDTSKSIVQPRGRGRGNKK